jgi:ABC-type multidrug transport system permease subunit
MKIIDLALKDLTRSFRSVFAVLFMFGIPLLITGMFYIMFGGMNNGSAGFSLPQTSVVIANLDSGSPNFDATGGQFPASANIHSMGDMVIYVLQQDNLSALMKVTRVDSAAAARAAVDAQTAGVAVIIPSDFSAQYSSLDGQAVLEVYQDPALTLGPAIVRSVLNQFMDGLSGTKIAISVATQQTGSSDPAFIGQVVQAYLAASAQTRDPAALLDVHTPVAAQTEEVPLLVSILGPIMGGMTIFYAFYTGTATAQTLLAEDEMGTLPRLFTTPTTHATILGGKLLAVLLTVTIQLLVLLTLGMLIFGIHWGSLPAVLLFGAGTILVASAFGVFVNSLMKNTKQGGIVFGGVLTFSGMLGMLPVFTMGNSTPALETISLFVPQGWAIHGLFQSMQGASTGSVALTMLVMLVWSVVFFAIGVWRFQKRYA